MYAYVVCVCMQRVSSMLPVYLLDLESGNKRLLLLLLTVYVNMQLH